MKKPITRTTLGKEIYHELRQHILSGKAPPGSRLIVAHLAEMLELSATPVHEALSALEREGLAIYTPRRGYTVPKLSSENIEEIYVVREAFEVLMVRLAAEKANDKARQELTDLINAMESDVQRNDTTTFAENDLAFHRAIWNAVENSLAERIGEIIEGQFRLLIAILSRTEGRFNGALDEHKDIVAAINAHDGPRAEAAMRTHIQRSKASTILAQASSPPKSQRSFAHR